VRIAQQNKVALKISDKGESGMMEMSNYFQFDLESIQLSEILLGAILLQYRKTFILEFGQP